ncbi:MAG: hypothetical protein ABL888_20960 [Pirellulaceae bacterium]
MSPDPFDSHERGDRVNYVEPLFNPGICDFSLLLLFSQGRQQSQVGQLLFFHQPASGAK